MTNDQNTIIKNYKTLDRKTETVFRGYRYIGNSRLYGARWRLRAKIDNTEDLIDGFYEIQQLLSLNYVTKMVIPVINSKKVLKILIVYTPW